MAQYPGLKLAAKEQSPTDVWGKAAGECRKLYKERDRWVETIAETQVNLEDMEANMLPGVQAYHQGGEGRA